MKILLIILTLSFANTAFAVFKTCDELQVKIECGERWELLWNIGERLKFYESKTPKDSALILKLRDFRAELDIMTNARYTAQMGNIIKSSLPYESKFDAATSSPILGAVQKPDVKIVLQKRILELLVALKSLLEKIIGLKK